MNSDQVLSGVRWLISVFGGLAVGHGLITADQLATIGGLAVSMVPLAWSMLAVHTDDGKIASAARVPDVARIVTTPAKASQIQSPKVVSS